MRTVCFVNRDVDVVAHELIRDAVTHRLDVDDGTAGYASAPSLLPTRQRTRRQGTQGRLLLADEAITRPLGRRAVDALIGLVHPLGQILLARGKRRDGANRQRIALHEPHRGRDLAFGPRAIRGARARLHVPVTTEGQIASMECHRAGRPIAPRARGRGQCRRARRARRRRSAGRPPRCPHANRPGAQGETL
jgi:hypothetical protein